MFQCPLSGLSHFYRRRHSPSRWNPMSFNALYRAYLISTNNAKEVFEHIKKVSMPFIGLISFLRIDLDFLENHMSMFQCPLSGLSHFYFFVRRIEGPQVYVSMPFIGLISFLLIKCNIMSVNRYVSMPFIGLISFLHAVYV